MRLIYLGDIVGRSGREAVCRLLPELRGDPSSFVVVNGENAAAGFGITPGICDELFTAGADVIVTGNHVFDKKEIIPFLSRDRRVLRPLNYPEKTPGFGWGIYPARNGRRVGVVQVMGQRFMNGMLDCPFAAITRLMPALSGQTDLLLVDIHAEASSEKMAMGHFCDGRATLVVGSHTHVPTADHRILPKGTAYQTDAGMCGDYDSVIGMALGTAMPRFAMKYSQERLQPATGVATVCGIVVDADTQTGLARDVSPLRIGGALQQPAGSTPQATGHKESGWKTKTTPGRESMWTPP